MKRSICLMLFTLGVLMTAVSCSYDGTRTEWVDCATVSDNSCIPVQELNVNSGLVVDFVRNSAVYSDSHLSFEMNDYCIINVELHDLYLCNRYFDPAGQFC